MLIGFSLSNCIRDIIEGRVELDDVEYIITGTKIETDLQLEETFDCYTQHHWQHNPRKATMIFALLWRSGRIFQPRVLGGNAPFTFAGHWMQGEVTHVSDIVREVRVRE